MPQRIPLDELGRKRCGRCGAYKPLSEFQKSSRSPDGAQWECKACYKVSRKGQYKRRNSTFVAYRESKREQAKQYAQSYYQQNAEEVRRKNNQYRIRNPQSRLWRRLWSKRHPEQQKAQHHARKARKLGNGGRLTAAEWRALKAHYNYTCLCCGKAEPEIKLTPDHVVPLARGGSNGIENIQPLCLSCNCSKRTQAIDYRY